jgi:hypothetical protein
LAATTERFAERERGFDAGKSGSGAGSCAVGKAQKGQVGSAAGADYRFVTQIRFERLCFALVFFKKKKKKKKL